MQVNIPVPWILRDSGSFVAMVQNVYFKISMFGVIPWENELHVFSRSRSHKKHCFQMFAWILELYGTIVRVQHPMVKGFLSESFESPYERDWLELLPPTQNAVVTTRIFMPFL